MLKSKVDLNKGLWLTNHKTIMTILRCFTVFTCRSCCLGFDAQGFVIFDIICRIMIKTCPII